ATTEGISLIRAERLERPATAGARRLVERAREELYEYFQGKRAFFSVPVDLSETPDFQRRVLEAARRIPFGEVRPYAGVSRTRGRWAIARARSASRRVPREPVDRRQAGRPRLGGHRRLPRRVGLCPHALALDRRGMRDVADPLR